MQLEFECIQQFTIEKSKFIVYLNRCFCEEDARNYISSVRKLNPKANHCCSAYIIGENNELTRCSDDGEPSSTAGLPILSSLKGSGVKNIVSVVVRYFGGVKLGTGGLIRAYSSCVTSTLNQASKLDTKLMNYYEIKIPYNLQGKVMYAIKDETLINVVYDVDILIEFMSEHNIIEKVLNELCSGKHHCKLIKTEMVEIKL